MSKLSAANRYRIEKSRYCYAVVDVATGDTRWQGPTRREAMKEIVRMLAHEIELAAFVATECPWLGQR